MNTTNRLLTIFVALILSASPVFGSKNLDRLMSILQYEQQFKNYLEICLRFNQALPPEDLLQDNPNYFLGFNPKSPEWPQVVEIYNEYYETSCKYLTSREFSSTLSENYGKRLSEDDLAEAVRFYSSPVGEKLVQVRLEANDELQRMVNEMASEQTSKACIEYNKQLTDLAKKSQKKPWWKFWQNALTSQSSRPATPAADFCH